MKQLEPNKLHTHHCEPCEGGVDPLTREQFAQYLSVVPEWMVDASDKSISRTIVLKDFVQAMAFVNKVAAVAQSEGHHPDLNLHGWNKVTITLSTRAIGGLSNNDFIVAARIDQLIAHT